VVLNGKWFTEEDLKARLEALARAFTKRRDGPGRQAARCSDRTAAIDRSERRFELLDETRLRDEAEHAIDALAALKIITVGIETTEKRAATPGALSTSTFRRSRRVPSIRPRGRRSPARGARHGPHHAAWEIDEHRERGIRDRKIERIVVEVDRLAWGFRSGVGSSWLSRCFSIRWKLRSIRGPRSIRPLGWPSREKVSGMKVHRSHRRGVDAKFRAVLAADERMAVARLPARSHGASDREPCVRSARAVP